MTNSLEHLILNAHQIEVKLGYQFRHKSLLGLSFVHRSYVNENRQITNQHNERLEFLGDSVLGILIAEYLYRQLPGTPEGDLSHLRSRLVEGSSCVAYIQKLGVEEFLLLGKGERMNDGRGRETILSDLFEALIGAIYLDGGIEAARQFLFGHFQEEIEAILREPSKNWKAELQDYAQRVHQQTPKYKVISEIGPDHSKEFTIGVYIGEEEIGLGKGSSKKEAQQAAAEDAMTREGKIQDYLRRRVS